MMIAVKIRVRGTFNHVRGKSDVIKMKGTTAEAARKKTGTMNLAMKVCREDSVRLNSECLFHLSLWEPLILSLVADLPNPKNAVIYYLAPI